MRVNGLDIVTSSHCLEEGPPVRVNLSWKQRLFSWPWRPGVDHYMKPSLVPSRKILRVGNTLIMHPVMAVEIQRKNELGISVLGDLT